uniref:Uncharacterized protein n=1 Tax=Mesocestoides corti TaxID=53468 RepID=A0A5K3FXB6_MESCO
MCVCVCESPLDTRPSPTPRPSSQSGLLGPSGGGGCWKKGGEQKTGIFRSTVV